MARRSAKRSVFRAVRRDLVGYKIWVTMLCIVVVLQCVQIYWMDIHVHDATELLGREKPNLVEQKKENILEVEDDMKYIVLDNSFEEDAEASEKCRLIKSPWSNRLHVPDILSNMADWSFSTHRQCPKISIENLPNYRSKFSIMCHGPIPKIEISETNDSFDVHTVDFENSCLSQFVDDCCVDETPVPNVVHLVWFGEKTLGFFNFLNLMSIHRFVKPCLILIHGPNLPHGPYWDYFLHLSPNIIHVRRERPDSVFGNQLRFKEHSSDVMRLEALIRFGGIYLDFDEVVLRHLDSLRRFQHTQGHELPKTMGSQLVISKKNAAFLQLWYQSYKNDYKKIWAYNALWVPNTLAKDHPELIHVEGFKFTRPSWKNASLIFDHNFNWSTNYAMHMYARWYRRPVDVDMIRTLNTTVGSVARHILFGNKELCIK